MATRKKTATKKKKTATKKKTTATKKKTTATKKKAPAKKKATRAAPAARTTTAAKKKVATRVVPSPSSTPRAAKLPWIWKYASGKQCVGLWVDDDFVWASNDNGDVVALTHDGEVHKQMKLPKGSVAAIADEAWKYAGCADGKVYDLTGRVPRAIYDVGSANIGWLEIHRGNLALADLKGTVAVYDALGEERWKQTVKGGGEGWVCRTDGTGVYHGSEIGLRKLSWQGELLWHNKEVGDVRFAVVDGDEVIMTAGYQKRGSADLFVVGADKGETRKKVVLTSKLPGFRHTGAEGCAFARGATAAESRTYVGAGGALMVFDGNGKKVWEATVDGDAVCNMMLHPVNGAPALFFSTGNGNVQRLDISDEAIARALQGSVTATRTVKRVEAADDDGHVEVVKDVGSGVVVEVVKIKGEGLKVRPVSDGYKKDWYCQFPRDLRVEGARFVVDELREAAQGGFYRALGDIKRLEE